MRWHAPRFSRLRHKSDRAARPARARRRRGVLRRHRLPSEPRYLPLIPALSLALTFTHAQLDFQIHLHFSSKNHKLALRLWAASSIAHAPIPIARDTYE